MTDAEAAKAPLEKVTDFVEDKGVDARASVGAVRGRDADDAAAQANLERERLFAASSKSSRRRDLGSVPALEVEDVADRIAEGRRRALRASFALGRCPTTSVVPSAAPAERLRASQRIGMLDRNPRGGRGVGRGSSAS